jgi:DNA-binding NarL/FixJ family response regulator
MIRIVLADDHPVVREGLRAMLSAEPDLEVVADASSGPQAGALAAELRPDIVLMDLRMPDGAGVDSIVRMTKAGLPSRVIVLTTYESGRDILRALEVGAAGYLLKDLPRAELTDAVWAAARGETVLAPSDAARLVDQLRARPLRPRLSERESAVLRLVADGCTNAEIGRRLFIAESTVKTHLLRIFTKLGVDDRTAAVTSAMRHGLLDPRRRGPWVAPGSPAHPISRASTPPRTRSRSGRPPSAHRVHVLEPDPARDPACRHDRAAGAAAVRVRAPVWVRDGRPPQPPEPGPSVGLVAHCCTALFRRLHRCNTEHPVQ